MGQRQDKDVIEYGDDCLLGWETGKTPKYLYARFSKLVSCKDEIPPVEQHPPNDRAFKLTQLEGYPCEWEYFRPPWWLMFLVWPSPLRTRLALLETPTEFGHFLGENPGPPDEGHVYDNWQTACIYPAAAKLGIATVTWRIETIKLMGLLNIKTQKDLFMEMRPLADGHKVYKYCNLKDATNIAIKCLPGKVYQVTGTLTPDATGDYHKHIMHNGKMSYRRTDGLYFLWWDGATRWVINTGLDVLFPPAWLRVDPNPVGDYQPIGDWLGVATVAEIW